MNQTKLNWYLRIGSIIGLLLITQESSFANPFLSTGESTVAKATPIPQIQTDQTPKIRRISLSSDRLEGGAQVEIKGKNFTPDTVVVVGDAVATNTQVIKGKKIKFTVPPQKAPGVRNLSVWTPNGIAQMPFQIIPKKLDELADGEVTTIAGGIEYLGDGDNQQNAILNRPTRIVADSIGNLFIADTYSHRIRRIDAKTGTITTIAGTGRQGFDGDNGPALAARLAYPLSLALSSKGTLFFLDLGNQRVRQINLKSGIISTVAGNGRRGFSGDNGPAQAASLSVGGLFSDFQKSGGIAVDQAENLFIADRENQRIRRVDAESGIIKTIVGTGIVEFSGDGGPASQADIFLPTNVAIDPNGNLFIADSGNNRIRRVDARTNIITTVAGNGAPGSRGDGGPALEAATEADSVVLDQSGNLFILEQFPRRIRRVDNISNTITTIAGNGNPGSQDSENGQNATQVGLGVKIDGGMNVDENGDILIVEPELNRIRKVVVQTGTIFSLIETQLDQIGDNGPAINAIFQFRPYREFVDPSEDRRGAITVSQDGSLIIVDSGHHRVRKVDLSTNKISTIIGTGISGFNGDNQLAGRTLLSEPSAVAGDSAGHFLIADYGNQRVRRVDAQTGIVTTVAGNGSDKLNADYDEDYNEYSFLDDGGPAVEASIPNPRGIALDEAGNLFISNFGLFIRRVDAQTQIITTRLGCCSGSNSRSLRGLAFSPGGILYAANANRGIVKLEPNATTPIVLFFAKPFFDVAVNGNGIVFAPVMTEHRIYRIGQPVESLTSIAGGTLGYAGDNGPATEAAFSSPSAVAIDGANNLYIVDSGNNAVRVIKNGAR